MEADERQMLFLVFIWASVIQTVSACAGDCGNDWWKWICAGFGVIFFMVFLRFLKSKRGRRLTIGVQKPTCNAQGTGNLERSEQGESDTHTTRCPITQLIRSNRDVHHNRCGRPKKDPATLSNTVVIGQHSFDPNNQQSVTRQNTSVPGESVNIATSSLNDPNTVPVSYISPPELYSSHVFNPVPGVALPIDPPSYESVTASHEYNPPPQYTR